MAKNLTNGIVKGKSAGKPIEFGIRSPKSDFDKRPKDLQNDSTASYVKGEKAGENANFKKFS